MRIPVLILILTSLTNATAQEANVIQDELNRSSDVIKEAIKENTITQQSIDFVEKFLEWKIQENHQAYMLSLDIPYPDILNPKDYFSITVVKFKGKERPRVISFSVSTMVDPTKGLSFYFARSNPDRSVSMSDVKFENIAFTEVNPEFIKVTAEYMFLDTSETMDLFEPMLNNNYLIFEFYDVSGQAYKISYPLLYFKNKIEELM